MTLQLCGAVRAHSLRPPGGSRWTVTPTSAGFFARTFCARELGHRGLRGGSLDKPVRDPWDGHALGMNHNRSSTTSEVGPLCTRDDVRVDCRPPAHSPCALVTTKICPLAGYNAAPGRTVFGSNSGVAHGTPDAITCWSRRNRGAAAL